MKDFVQSGLNDFSDDATTSLSTVYSFREDVLRRNLEWEREYFGLCKKCQKAAVITKATGALRLAGRSLYDARDRSFLLSMMQHWAAFYYSVFGDVLDVSVEKFDPSTVPTKLASRESCAFSDDVYLPRSYFARLVQIYVSLVITQVVPVHDVSGGSLKRAAKHFFFRIF